MWRCRRHARRSRVRPATARIPTGGSSKNDRDNQRRAAMARILAVDDSAAMRQMVGITLTGAGHQVEQAIDGREALQIAERSKFDLVITDVNMPNMDGITLVRELRGMANYKFVPMLVLTTEA